MSDSTDRTDLTVSLVSAYVHTNHVPRDELPRLLTSVHAAIVGLGQPAAPAEPEAAKASPAQIKASIRPDGLVSFLDGKPHKTLKRHLTVHGLTPEGYRARFGLPADYPMVCANYSEQRSALAKAAGLGQAGRAAPAAQAAE